MRPPAAPPPPIRSCCSNRNDQPVATSRLAYGITPAQCLRARRIERARELLTNTPLPVTEICGFPGALRIALFVFDGRHRIDARRAARRHMRRQQPHQQDCGR
jgi:methylphosphotriester-DNA--protein-cysteine methyltransferase